MSNYTIKNLISVICFIISGFCFALSVVCLTEWETVFYTVVAAFISIIYCIIGLHVQRGAQEDYVDYISKRKEVGKIYFELSHMHKKYYWALNVDSIIPSYKDKHSLLAWAADIAVVCQAYRHDHKTEELDPNTDQDLSIMIGLAQDLIEFKKYL